MNIDSQETLLKTSSIMVFYSRDAKKQVKNHFFYQTAIFRTPFFAPNGGAPGVH